MLDLLQEVLTEAHSSHQYITDRAQYSLPEYWTASLTGDCEDFALFLREKLKELNIASNLIYCLTELGEGHLVLNVEGWILDNRHQWVVNKNDLDYTWVSLGTPDGIWYEIKG